MNLMNLLLKNQKTPRSFRMEQKGREATVYLYDVIGEDWYGGVSAQQFVKDLTALDVDTIHLRINSPGGDVFEGRTMATALRQAKAKTIAHIDGHAASAATYVALACSEVRIAPGAFFMIHNAWTVAIGSANDLIQSADLLKKVDASIASDYMQKTGATLKQVQDWMDAETWFPAEEALANGFVDSIEQDAPAAKNSWDLSAFTNAPAALTNPPRNDENIQPDRESLNRRLAMLEKIAA